jgi:hypothetical protein
MQGEEISREELNTVLKNVENFYWAVVQAGYFIP